MARSSNGALRYGDVVLTATAVHDQVLAASLQDLYLGPLCDERDGGQTAKETLYAYFACDRTISSAAKVLGVDRKTVASRLRAIEYRIGRPLVSCGAALETAIHMDAVSSPDEDRH